MESPKRLGTILFYGIAYGLFICTIAQLLGCAGDVPAPTVNPPAAVQACQPMGNWDIKVTLDGPPCALAPAPGPQALTVSPGDNDITLTATSVDGYPRLGTFEPDSCSLSQAFFGAGAGIVVRANQQFTFSYDNVTGRAEYATQQSDGSTCGTALVLVGARR